MNIYKMFKSNLKLGKKLRGANVSGTTGSAATANSAPML